MTGDRRRIVVLGDDLIWSERLTRLVAAAGADPVTARDAASYRAALADAEGVIIDLTATRYEPLTAIERAHGAGLRVLAVGQHDDHALRKRALAAGAERVYAYRKLFEDGPATVAGWLAGAATTA